MEDRFYMTNVEPFDGIHVIVEKAAGLSGLAVKYHDHPMPFDPFDPEAFDDEGGPTYDPKWCQGMGSISTMDRGADHSFFWTLFDYFKEARVAVPA